MTNAEKSPSGGGGSGGSSGGGSGDDGYSDRGCNPSGGYTNDLRLDYVEFHDDSEGWGKGDPEMRAQLTRYETSTDEMNNIGEIVDLAGQISEDQAEDGRTECTADGEKDGVVLDWHTDDYYAYHFKWLEEDGDYNEIFTIEGPFTIPTPAGDVNVEEFGVTVHDDDDGLGEKLVYLEDLTDNPEQEQAYSIGQPDFKLTLVE
jgi:hypothetical protein